MNCDEELDCIDCNFPITDGSGSDTIIRSVFKFFASDLYSSEKTICASSPVNKLCACDTKN